jgi:hypothetical protein
VRAVIHRPDKAGGHGSWRPCSLTDGRGPKFPEEYREVLTLEAKGVAHALEQYRSELGDVIVLGEGDESEAFVAAPFGWEPVK